MTAIEKFLSVVGNSEIYCCQKIKDDGNLIGVSGQIVFHDSKHIILRTEKSLHLISIDNILELEYTPEYEIILDGE